MGPLVVIESRNKNSLQLDQRLFNCLYSHDSWNNCKHQFNIYGSCENKLYQGGGYVGLIPLSIYSGCNDTFFQAFSGMLENKSSLISTAIRQFLKESETFLFYDERSETCIASVDALGKIPLYYYEDEHFFALSNSIEALVRLPGIPCEPDYRQLILGSMDPNTLGTGYRKISRLQGGCFLLKPSEKKSSTQIYWSPFHIRREKLVGTSEAYYEQLEPIFRQAVKIRSEGCENLTCHLSGGLDSSSVCGALATLYPDKEIYAFYYELGSKPKSKTGSRALWDVSEDLAEFRAKFPNVTLHKRRYGDFNMLQGLEELCSSVPLPPRLWINGIRFRNAYHEISGMGCDRIFSGTAGNWSISYRGFLSNRKRFKKQLTTVIHEIRKGELIERFSKASHPLNRIFHENIIDELDIDVRKPSIAGWPSRRAHFLAAPYHGIFETTGVFDVDPTADINVVEYCLKSPKELFYRQGIGRQLARSGLRNYLTPKIRLNTQRGIQSDDWIDTHIKHRSTILDLLSEYRCHADLASILNLDLFERAIRKFNGRTEDLKPENMWLIRVALSRVILFGYFTLKIKKIDREKNALSA